MTIHTARFEQDIAALGPALLRLARHLSRDPQEAEDVVQDVLLATLRRCRRHGPIKDLRPYLHAALRNRLRHPPEKAQEASAEAPCRGAAQDRLMLRDVQTALAQLPAAQADLLRAYALAGLSYEEIARRTGLPKGTVMSRLARARAALRAALELPQTGAVGALIAPDMSP